MRWAIVYFVLLLLALRPSPASGATFREADAWLDRELDRDDVLLLTRPHGHGERRRPPFALSLATFMTSHASDAAPTTDQARGWGFAITVSIPTNRTEPPRERAPPILRSAIALPQGLAKRCVQAAWQAAGLGTDKQLDGMARRARLSAALPEVRLRASRGIDAQARIDTDYDSERFADTSSSSLWLEARFTWRLDRALFADEEIQVERLMHDRRELRLRIMHKVLETLSHWLRAKSDSVNAIDDETRIGATIRLSEAEGALDALTDGWFQTANTR